MKFYLRIIGDILYSIMIYILIYLLCVIAAYIFIPVGHNSWLFGFILYILLLIIIVGKN